MAPPFLRARWTDLLMLSWEVPPDVLAPHVPRGTALDLRDGRAYVSLVGFMFRDTRVVGVPVPGHVHFPEVNLRFYVEGEGQHGVAFLREIVPRRALAWTARALYGERYDARPMRATADDTEVRCSWRDAGAHAFGARRAGPWEAPRGLDHFLVDHLVGFVATRGGSTLAYDVEHPPWRVQRVEDVRMEVDLAASYGAVGEALRGDPASALVADGSAVAVHWPRRLRVGPPVGV